LCHENIINELLLYEKLSKTIERFYLISFCNSLAVPAESLSLRARLVSFGTVLC